MFLFAPAEERNSQRRNVTPHSFAFDKICCRQDFTKAELLTDCCPSTEPTSHRFGRQPKCQTAICQRDIELSCGCRLAVCRTKSDTSLVSGTCNVRWILINSDPISFAFCNCHEIYADSSFPTVRTSYVHAPSPPPAQTGVNYGAKIGAT